MITLEKIEAIAPDQASLNAAKKLLSATKWPLSAINAEKTFIWGECQGSGSTPYRTCVEVADLGYKCSCPSRKFPCKHAIALMWRYHNDASGFGLGEIPDWVETWAGRRRKSATTNTTETKKPSGSITAALKEKEKPKDPKAIARAEKAKEKNRQKREAAISDGIEDFHQWLIDVYDNGLLSFLQDCTKRCQNAAKRLVDAKAPGLASQLEALPGELYSIPEATRSRYVYQYLSNLYLQSCAYQRQDQLPGDLRQDVRRLAGWTISRDELLSLKAKETLDGPWKVVACLDHVQSDGLQRMETWLWRVVSPHRFAVLIDYSPVSMGRVSQPFSPGEVLTGKAHFFPSATPMRAILTDHKPTDKQASVTGGTSLHIALEERLSYCVKNPFLRSWPLTVSEPSVKIDNTGSAWVTEGNTSLPLNAPQIDSLIALSTAKISHATVSWDGWRGQLLCAETDLGFWSGTR
ncbi:MAG: SWIM zinc finger family protein [Pseudomonadota bacterium]